MRGLHCENSLYEHVFGLILKTVFNSLFHDPILLVHCTMEIRFSFNFAKKPTIREQQYEKQLSATLGCRLIEMGFK